MRTKIAYDESSKGVTAHVTVEGDDVKELDSEYNDKILAETERLYIEAEKFSHKRTLQKRL